MRLLFVISEHGGALDAALRERYERIRSRIASLADATVESVQYEKVDRLDADAVVLSGSHDPWSAHAPGALDRFVGVLRDHRRPTLGICAGMQLQARALGGAVGPAAAPTRGYSRVEVIDGTDLLADVGPALEVLQDHADELTTVPAGVRVLARSATCEVEAFAALDRPWWGTQFHPEAWTEEHPGGEAILRRFLALAGVPAR